MYITVLWPLTGGTIRRAFWKTVSQVITLRLAEIKFSNSFFRLTIDYFFSLTDLLQIKSNPQFRKIYMSALYAHRPHIRPRWLPRRGAENLYYTQTLLENRRESSPTDFMKILIVIYNKKYVFAHHPHFRHRAPQPLEFPNQWEP